MIKIRAVFVYFLNYKLPVFCLNAGINSILTVAYKPVKNHEHTNFFSFLNLQQNNAEDSWELEVVSFYALIKECTM